MFTCMLYVYLFQNRPEFWEWVLLLQYFDARVTQSFWTVPALYKSLIRRSGIKIPPKIFWTTETLFEIIFVPAITHVLTFTFITPQNVHLIYCSEINTREKTCFLDLKMHVFFCLFGMLTTVQSCI